MADEYIKREDAHIAIEKAETGYWGSEGHVIWADDAHRKINAVPSADVAPVVHWKWVHLGGSDWCCSACGNVICTEGSWEHPLERGYSYCPNCGADMRKDGE